MVIVEASQHTEERKMLQVAQDIVTKLDLGAITLKEAKQFAKRFGLNATGRTKEQFIRSLIRAANAV